MSLPPFFQMVIVVFIASLIFSIVWVYFGPQNVPTKPETPDEAEQRRIEAAQSRERRAAQERLFTELERTKAIRAERQAMNARPYNVSLLPPTHTRLTVISAYTIDYDAYRAFAYLCPDWVDFTFEQFDAYWDDPHKALWVWHGDNMIESYGEEELQRVVQGQSMQMHRALTRHGWQVAHKVAHEARPHQTIFVTHYQRLA